MAVIATRLLRCLLVLCLSAQGTQGLAQASAPSSSDTDCPGKGCPAKPAPPMSEKVTYAADAFFSRGVSDLSPAAKAKLDDLVKKVGGINLEVIVVVGHAGSEGSDAENQALSTRRAEAVQAYLVGKGVERNRVYAEGKGSKRPVADNKTAEGRAKNRRVEIEVVGTRAKK
jgi:OmpA-OmpF porin, OOP family